MENLKLARCYYKLLNSLDWNDDLLVSGMREGLNKFLSNAYLASTPGKNKYHKTHFISSNALEQLKSNCSTGLVFEHIVPKTKYIQEPCERLARSQELTAEHVEYIINRYWKLATITTAEDEKLTRLAMPKEWDEVDVFARYKVVGINLIVNPYFHKS